MVLLHIAQMFYWISSTSTFLEIRLISRRTDNPRLVHSPDFSPADNFLRGYEEKVHNNNPQTLEALKTNNRHEIQRIPLEMCGNVIASFNVRVAAVIHTRGTCH